jgi:hypothetical protein
LRLAAASVVVCKALATASFAFIKLS